MSEFQFTACDIKGASRKGLVEADSAEAVGMELDSRGLIPISIKQKRTFGESFKAKQTNTKWRIEEKILFTRKSAPCFRLGFRCCVFSIWLRIRQEIRALLSACAISPT